MLTLLAINFANDLFFRKQIFLVTFIIPDLGNSSLRDFRTKVYDMQDEPVSGPALIHWPSPILRFQQ